MSKCLVEVSVGLQGREGHSEEPAEVSSLLRESGPPLDIKSSDVMFSSEQPLLFRAQALSCELVTPTESPGQGQVGQPGFKMLLLMLSLPVQQLCVVPHPLIPLGAWGAGWEHNDGGGLHILIPPGEASLDRAPRCISSTFVPETSTRRILPCPPNL